MVYCGKLSKACLPCRRRKLLCDLKKHGCSQCSRAQLTCSGYRDTEALRFRNESNAVQKKVHARNAAKSIPPAVAISASSRAKDIFYHDYVVGPTKPLHFLLAFQSSKNELLSKSIYAVALAYLHYQRHSLDTREEARQHYTKALSLTSATLKYPDRAKKDATLLAVLLLDLYEKIIDKELKFEGPRAAHLSGALSLVKLRDDQQFKDPITLGILMRLSTSLLISCAASNRPVSAELITLRSKITAYSPTPCDPKWRESDLMIEFIRIRRDMENIVVSNEVAINLLVNLDVQFSKLALEVPPSWQYQTIYMDKEADHHYKMYYHIYPADNVAQMWNTLRLIRILLNELIYSRCLDCEGGARNDARAPTLQHDAVEIIKDMASDICAAVPQFIGDLSAPFQKPARTSLDGDVLPRHSNPTDHLPCYRLIYPLYVAAQSFAAPASLKSWAIEQLHFMAEYHGIENAASVMRILESSEKGDIWRVYAILGSYAFVC
ncbi:hypothetical protein MMC14_002856 [Varicellaria rhodocarpa]|nr:hypothetical protein [Varicellaria rhodocarpa]